MSLSVYVFKCRVAAKNMTSEISAQLTFSVDGKTVETSASGSYQVARIRGIKAKELRESFTMTVRAGETVGTVTHSPMNYCYDILNGGTEDENLINVIKALVLYAQAADAYFTV